MMNNHNMNLKP